MIVPATEPAARIATPEADDPDAFRVLVVIGKCPEHVKSTLPPNTQAIEYESFAEAVRKCKADLHRFWPPPTEVQIVSDKRGSDLTPAENEALGQLKVRLSSEMSLLRGGRVFARRLARNLQRNYEYVRCKGAVSLIDIVRPEDFVLVVGAGPSIKGHIYEIIEELRHVPRGRLAVLVTDRAVATVRYFAREFAALGARVAAVSIEPRPVKCGLMAHIPADWHLIAPMSAHPRTALSYGRKMAWTGIPAGELLTGLPRVSPSTSVSGQAVQIAADCSASAIACVGIDCAFKDTTHADGNDPRHVKCDRVLVPGLRGDDVPTSEIMNQVRLDMARVFADVEKRGVWVANCSSWGAVIPGAAHCRLREAVKTYTKTVLPIMRASPLTACVSLHSRSEEGDEVGAVADLTRMIQLAHIQNAG